MAGAVGGKLRMVTMSECLMLPRAPNRDQTVRGPWGTVRGVEPEGSEAKAIGLARVGCVCSDAQSMLAASCPSGPAMPGCVPEDICVLALGPGGRRPA